MTEKFIADLKQNSYQEYVLGDYKVGRYAWVLTDIKPLENPIEAKGKLNIWNYEEDKYSFFHLLKPNSYTNMKGQIYEKL